MNQNKTVMKKLLSITTIIFILICLIFLTYKFFQIKKIKLAQATENIEINTIIKKDIQDINDQQKENLTIYKTSDSSQDHKYISLPDIIKMRDAFGKDLENYESNLYTGFTLDTNLLPQNGLRVLS